MRYLQVCYIRYFGSFSRVCGYPLNDLYTLLYQFIGDSYDSGSYSVGSVTIRPTSAGSRRIEQNRTFQNLDSPEWDAVLAKLAAEIKVRHYSRKTLKAYAKWSRSFQRFLKKNKCPEELSLHLTRNDTPAVHPDTVRWGRPGIP